MKAVLATGIIFWIAALLNTGYILTAMTLVILGACYGLTRS